MTGIAKMRLTDRLLILHMLKILDGKTMNRSDWQMATQIHFVKFNKLLKIVLGEKYVERVKRGIYRITDDGKKFGKFDG